MNNSKNSLMKINFSNEKTKVKIGVNKCEVNFQELPKTTIFRENWVEKAYKKSEINNLIKNRFEWLRRDKSWNWIEQMWSVT